MSSGHGDAFGAIWGERKPLVGMVHLLPLPGAPHWEADMAPVLGRAQSDAEALEAAGFDGVLVENFLDAPFHADRVPAETVAAMALAVDAVRRTVALPVGVNVLRNDARAALAVAVATGARFVRINVHTGVMHTDQGTIEGRAAETLRRRAALGADIALLADVLVKHATPPAGVRLEDAARDCYWRGLADALVISGSGTGQATDPERLARVRAAVPEAPVLVGSGVTAGSARALLEASAGLIVGTAVTREGRAGSGVDRARARAVVEAARG